MAESDTVDLRALVQRLRWDANFVAREGYFGVRDDMRAAATELESLLARAEAAEAEYARLRQNAERLEYLTDRWVEVYTTDEQGQPYRILLNGGGSQLLERIDRAIAEGKHEA